MDITVGTHALLGKGIDFKGMETERKDTLPFVRTILQDIVRALFHDGLAAFVGSPIAIAVDVIAAHIFTRQHIAYAGLNPTLVIAVHHATATNPHTQGRR